MGIDVFGLWQSRQGEKWTSVGRLYWGTRGSVRAWLGWGGRLWGGDVFPIAPLRGWPADFDPTEQLKLGLPRVDDMESWPVNFDPAKPLEFAGHSRTIAEDVVGSPPYSWVSAEEILAAPAIFVYQTDISVEQYQATWDLLDDLPKWQDVTDFQLKGYPCQLVEVVYPQLAPAYDARTVRVECLVDFSEDDEVIELVALAKRARELYSEVRLVYGFA
jgi:hypothetical protein